jgi:hypothetical protein
MFARSLLLALLAWLAATAVAPAQDDGRLQRVRQEVRAPDDPPAQKASKKHGDDDDPWGELIGDFFGEALLLLIAAPFRAPMDLLDDHWDRRLYLPRYPYPHAYPGYLLLSPADAAVLHETFSEGVRRRNWAGRLSLENGNDFSGLNRFAGQLRLDTSAYRIGFLTNWNFYTEDLPRGRRDELVIGDANAIFRFAQNEVASCYAGVGLRTLTDRCGSDFGFNFTYGGEWFPVRPLVVGASFDVGTLGNAGVLHGRATLGAVWRHWEVYGGYDFLRIGNVNLQGPLVGVRWWF